MKTVMITGVQGMDGSTLTDLYLEKGWRVVGIDRWQPTGRYPNLDNAFKNENFIIETGDIVDREFIYHVITKYKPEHLYNMAAISLVPESFKIPRHVFEINTLGALNILETIRYYSPHTRFYQASSSEQIGSNTNPLQNTESIMSPTSPYGVAKLASYHLTRIYRNAYKLFCVNGMLWNHEGPRRGPNFVTRKITLGVAAIVRGEKQFISLGNMDSYRDWGLSEDYCKAMMLMMEADKPDDYPVATGETHSIREFVEEAFFYIGLVITWKGKGLHECGYDQNGIIRVNVNEKYYRPAEVPKLHGDYTKTKKLLGWEPTVKFGKLVEIMMENDLNGV